MTDPDVSYDFANGKLTITLLSRCNLECNMCGIIREDKQGELTRDHAFQVADFGLARGFKLIELTGGEPLLLPYAHDLLEHLCRKAGPRTTILVTTNGTTFGPSNLKRLSTLVSYRSLQFQVSVDGLAREHNLIRAWDKAFDKTAWTIEKIHQLGIRLSINTVIQRANFQTLLQIYERFKGFNYEYHAFSLYGPGSPNIETVRIPPEDAAALRQRLNEVREAALRDGKEVVLTPAVVETYVRRVEGREAEMVHPGLGCTVPLRGVTVNHRGDVIPCSDYPWPSLFDARQNIGQASIESIVESQRYRDSIRKAVVEGSCAGCSTMCYNWDPDFRRKVMEPNLADELLRTIQSRGQSRNLGSLARETAEGARKLAFRYPAISKALRRNPRLFAAAQRLYGWIRAS